MNIWETAEKYHVGNLNSAEQEALHKRIASDPAFAAEFQEHIQLLQSLESRAKHKQFRTLLTDIRKGQSGKQPTIRTIPLSTHYWRTAAVAASIAIITTLSTFWMIKHSDKQRVSQYRMLRKEMESIRNSQNALISTVNDSKVSAPVVSASFSGTGIALANNGYFVTNYHVVEGADSVYMQSRSGSYYKANLIAFDKRNDVAILKVEDKKFNFSKADLPYSFAPGKNKIGTGVFTLSFPDNEVIYNEGYISTKNGYEGDSLQYLLNIPSNPGYSGAPVVTAAGSIIGIVSANNNENTLSTYAISSAAIYELTKTLPIQIKLPKTSQLKKLSREQQIEKMEPFTCSVKVYKKS